jgi:hypothetical protein
MIYNPARYFEREKIGQIMICPMIGETPEMIPSSPRVYAGFDPVPAVNKTLLTDITVISHSFK